MDLGKRLRSLRSSTLHPLRRRRRLRESEQISREMDSHDNAELALPDGEQIEWPCLWIGELFAPSHAEALSNGLRDLDSKQVSLFHNQPAAEWIKRARSWQGGFWSIGEFSNDERPFVGKSDIDLPDEFSMMRGELKQLAPGVTVAVFQFVLREKCAGRIQATLERDFETKVAPLKGTPGGEEVFGPQLRKEAAVGDVRAEIRGLARDWVAGHIPGLFSNIDEAGVPGWDLLLSRNEQLFERGEVDKRWRDLIGYAGSTAQWSSDRLPGLRIVSPLAQGSEAVAAVLGIKDEALRSLEDAHVGEGVSSLAFQVHRRVVDHWALWTLRKALQAHEQVFSDVRDQLGRVPSRLGSGRHLRRLRNEVMPMSFDLQTLGEAPAELGSLGVAIRRSSAEFTQVEQPKQETTRLSLMEVLANDVRREGQRVSRQGREISNGLRVQGELLLAATNVRLQRLVLFLTLIVGAAGVAATIISASGH